MPGEGKDSWVPNVQVVAGGVDEEGLGRGGIRPVFGEFSIADDAVG